ncbi:MAG: hypothetical protein DWQ36_22460 [Acidobacteria bacterium]|nr:MAG: hypothetical protein DWQ30_13810 [Acidobacteriota bacterium]REK00527.1 MAG: hypothetical protein DWQ36_22460 [Acidobacteriota bacterium]
MVDEPRPLPRAGSASSAEPSASEAPDLRPSLAERAEAAFAAARWDEATRLHRTLVTSDSPESRAAQTPRVLLRAAQLLLRPGGDLEDWRLAERLLERLRKADPTPDQRLAADVLLHLQRDLVRQYQRLEELKQIDLEEPPIR